MPTKHCECGAKYRFPEASIGKRAKCKKCGAIFTLEDEDELRVVPLAEPDSLGGLASAVQATGDRPSKPVERPISAAALPSAESEGRLGRVLIEETATEATYGRDLLESFTFPTASVGNTVTFVILWVLIFISQSLLRVGVVAGFVVCIGFFGKIVIVGWFTGFRFSVIQNAAGGEKELPTLSASEGWMDDIIVPLVKWIVSWIIVLSPAYVCLAILMYLGVAGGSPPLTSLFSGLGGIFQGVTPEEAVFFAFVLAGWAAWPMVILCVAIGGFASLGRPDAIIITLIRTFPFYLLTFFIVFGTDVLKGVLTGMLAGEMWGGMGAYILFGFLAAGVTVYFEIIAMRAIGLYYRHCRNRFAWAWD